MRDVMSLASICRTDYRSLAEVSAAFGLRARKNEAFVRTGLQVVSLAFTLDTARLVSCHSFQRISRVI